MEHEFHVREVYRNIQSKSQVSAREFTLPEGGQKTFCDIINSANKGQKNYVENIASGPCSDTANSIRDKQQRERQYYQ